MSAVSLDLLKKHCRADDYDADDAYLTHLRDTAEEQVCLMVNRYRGEVEQMCDDGWPLPLRQAVLMLAAHWFNQRESVSGVQMHEVPSAVEALTKPYRRLVSER